MKFCYQCGSQLEDDARFCHSCGAPQGEVSQNDNSQNQSQPHFHNPNGVDQYGNNQQTHNQQYAPQNVPNEPYRQTVNQGYQNPGNNQPQQPQNYGPQNYGHSNYQGGQKFQNYNGPGYGYNGPQHPNYPPQNLVQDNSNKKLNPLEQAVINFCARYCSPQSLTWSVVIASLATILYIFYIGVVVFNFKGILADISFKLIEVIPFWLIIDIFYLSILYLLLHLINGLYKSGAKWPLLYITPILFGLTFLILTIILLTEGSYSDGKSLQYLTLASYICFGIIGVLCSQIEYFSWTGKVLIITMICWLIQTLTTELNTVVSVFYFLSTIWLIYEINTRVRGFFHTYYPSDYQEYY